MTKAKYAELCDRILPMIHTSDSRFREVISNEEKLVVALRYLATGNNYTCLAIQFRMSIALISLVVDEVCELLWAVLQPIYMPTPTVFSMENRKILTAQCASL